MTIAPLPTMPVDMVVTGPQPATPHGHTAASFAALVLAVLDAGTPGAAGASAPDLSVPDADGTAAAGSPVLDAGDPFGFAAPSAVTGPDAEAATSTGVPVTHQVPQVHSGPAATADLPEIGPIDEAAGDPVDPADPVAIVPMPVSLPAALATALSLTAAAPGAPITPVTPDTPATAPVPAPDAAGGLAVDRARATSSSPDPTGPVGSAQASGGAARHPAPITTSTSAAPTAVGSSPATGAPEVPVAPATPDAPPATPDAPPATVSVEQPGRPAAAATVHVREAARGTESGRPQKAEPTERTDASAPTVVQGPPAPTRAADQPIGNVTRAAAAQVVPELTRLVQAGPGTHRMVLRLDPEHLGEVRITLTVHPGGVRVRMATGTEDARVALTDGVQALQRALENVSGRPAGETQVAVLHQARHHDPATTTAYDAQNPATHPDAQASHHQSPGDRPQADDRAAGRPAGTQVDTTARDGSQDGGAHGTPRPADPLPSSRSTRLDVSM